MNYDNRNRGQLWGVQKTETADPRSADFTGNMNAVCPHCSQSADFFVDGWKRKPDANPKAAALSFKVKAKNKQPSCVAPATGEKPLSGARNDMNDSIPFAPEFR